MTGYSFPDFKRLVPAALRPAAKAIYHRLFRFQLHIRFWWTDRFATPESEIPVPPAALRYYVSEELSVREFLRVGEGCANLMEQQAREMGIDLRNAGRVLEFGCGCGRIVRWFLTGGGSTEFHGVDVDIGSVQWCKDNLPSAHFLTNSPSPPLPYADGHFDVVYCLSVFTHLDESMQDRWLTELRRVLKPGGVLLFTIYGTAARGGLNAAELRQLADRGFVHKRSQKLKGLVPDWYQTSWHSRDYIVSRLGLGFADVRYRVVPDGLQDLVAARKNCEH